LEAWDRRLWCFAALRRAQGTRWWVELTRRAARGPVVIKVPTVGQFLHRWLEDTVAPNLAPPTYATYESHVRNYIEPGIGALGPTGFPATVTQAAAALPGAARVRRCTVAATTRPRRAPTVAPTRTSLG
jgi:hypothetical protein